MIRGSLAVLAGFVLMNLVTALFAWLLTAVFPAALGGATAVAAAGPGWALLSLLYSSIAAFAGGYVTAVAAGEQAARSVFALLFTVVGLGILSLLVSDGTSPVWYLVALLVASAPSILLGGWLFRARSSG